MQVQYPPQYFLRSAHFRSYFLRSFRAIQRTDVNISRMAQHNKARLTGGSEIGKRTTSSVYVSFWEDDIVSKVAGYGGIGRKEFEVIS
jgi:hypothetical protein